MKTIYLVRHGQTQANADGRFQGWEDHPLNETGRAQARNLAQRAGELPLAALYTSDPVRTKETLAPLAEKRHLVMEPVAGLREISFGEWEGQKISDIRRTQGRLLQSLWKHASSADIPGAEDLPAAQRRGWEAFDRIRRGMADHSAVMVACHGGMIRLLLCRMMDASLDSIWHLCIDNTAVCRIEYDDRIGYLIRYMNYLGAL